MTIEIIIRGDRWLCTSERWHWWFHIGTRGRMIDRGIGIGMYSMFKTGALDEKQEVYRAIAVELPWRRYYEFRGRAI